MKYNLDRKELFETKFVRGKPNECWPWLAGVSSGGYGKFHSFKKYPMAHRASYFFYKGEIPDGLCVLHRCDNPRCVNPDHLFLGTHQDNSDDKLKKGRHLYGGKMPNAKLSEKDVRFIRKHIVLYDSKYGARAMSKRFNVTVSRILKIVDRTIWKHVK